MPTPARVKTPTRHLPATPKKKLIRASFTRPAKDVIVPVEDTPTPIVVTPEIEDLPVMPVVSTSETVAPVVEPMDTAVSREPFRIPKTGVYFVAGMTTALLIGAIGYRMYSASLVPPSTSTSNAEEAKKLVEKIGQYMELPTGSVPTLATVTDIAKLKNQAFFARAANGDKVLIYADAKKAILYRPQTNKIIDVAPLVTSQTDMTGSPSSEPVTSPAAAVPTAPAAKKAYTFVLYNGSSKNGVTNTFEKTLTTKFPGSTVLDKSVAKSRTYEKSALIDLKNAGTAVAAPYAAAFNLMLTTLPPGETAPKDADFLIILGSDQVK
jgi:hypothetical protein